MSDNPRKADHEIERIFLERWSPRAFDGKPIDDGELESIFEAGRWAASSYNAQPWRIAFAKRQGPHFDTFVGLLTPSNQVWAKNAAVLFLIASKTTMIAPGAEKEIPYYSHSFDAGAAWANMALQATHLGIYAHAMAGFDKEKAKEALNVHQDWRPEAMVALGRRGDKSSLPEPLAKMEIPSQRHPITQFVFDGVFGS